MPRNEQESFIQCDHGGCFARLTKGGGEDAAKGWIVQTIASTGSIDEDAHTSYSRDYYCPEHAAEQRATRAGSTR